MHLQNFKKLQSRKKRRNLSISPFFSCFRGCIFFDHSSWQGQEDSNPRPTVLEWLWINLIPSKCSLFRRFAGIWKVFLKKSNLIDAFLMLCKYLRALVKSSTLCYRTLPSIQNSADKNWPCLTRFRRYEVKETVLFQLPEVQRHGRFPADGDRPQWLATMRAPIPDMIGVSVAIIMVSFPSNSHCVRFSNLQCQYGRQRLHLLS